jgi:GT2 family glycosyltransferase
MIDVSIIIVNWNTRDILRDCLSSVYDQTHGIFFELTVIDNASSDGSAAMVQNEFPDVILIKNIENVGFAAANNQGMRISKGRYVLLLNPDTIVLEEAIQKTISFSDNHPDIGVLGCQVWLNEHEIQQTCFSFPTLFSLTLQQAGLQRIFSNSKFIARSNYGWWERLNQMDVEVVSGMYMLVKREAIDQVGLMDEDYFVYAEETDWCYRFWKAGWRCVFTPEARIIHLDGGSKSTGQISIKMYVQMQKSMLIFFKKQRGYGSWVYLKIIFIISMLFRYFLFKGLSFITNGNLFLIKAKQSLAALKFHVFKSDLS